MNGGMRKVRQPMSGKVEIQLPTHLARDVPGLRVKSAAAAMLFPPISGILKVVIGVVVKLRIYRAIEVT